MDERKDGEEVKASRWGYVIFHCNGDIEVVECDRNTDCEAVAKKVIGCEEINLCEPRVRVGSRDISLNFLRNANEYADYKENFKEKANRAAFRFVGNVHFGEVIACDYGKFEGRDECGYIPIPLDDAFFVAGFAEGVEIFKEDWKPEEDWYVDVCAGRCYPTNEDFEGD